MSSLMSGFMVATREKIRFPSPKGDLSIEQLWDVPLRSTDGFNLDTIAKTVNKNLESATEESFVDAARETPLKKRIALTMDLVKIVIQVKLDEEQDQKAVAAKKLEKEKLLKILAEKQDDKLSELSIKELKQRIAEL